MAVVGAIQVRVSLWVDGTFQRLKPSNNKEIAYMYVRLPSCDSLTVMLALKAAKTVAAGGRSQQGT